MLPIRPQEDSAPLAIVKGRDRDDSIKKAFGLLEPLEFEGKDVYLKASYNSSDEFPASTHPETLDLVTRYLREKNARKIILVERSGMGDTREIWKKLGVPDVARSLEMELLPLESLPPHGWKAESAEGWHWAHGIEVPDFLTPGATVVQITNLRTHRFGGHFSASLKNSIGLIAKYGKGGSHYNYMAELHASPHQRAMVAEVNQVYSPALIVMDAMQVFVAGGPEKGDISSPETMVISRDRVAVDAVGVSLLKLAGAGGPLSGGVFEQDQIKRAVEIGLGIRSDKQIRFLAPDEPSQRVASQMSALLEPRLEEKK
jgi:uncharacterized protein (DUF362 family)